MGVHTTTPPLEPSSPHDGNVRKRVCKACDRCRLKKSKCDGSSPCSRCKADNAICVFGERKKSHDKIYPKGYVEMLENQQSQLVTGLQELYKRLQDGQGWVGSPLHESAQGTPLTHDILERLGALKSESHASSEDFEEDLHALQRRLLAGGAGFMKREASSDGGSEIGHSPIYESVPTKRPTFTDPFAHDHFPPTPPNRSPELPTNGTLPPLKTDSFSRPINGQSGMNPALLLRQSWNTPPIGFDDNMDFLNRFDSPIGYDSVPPQILQQQSSMNACLPTRDWADEDDFQRYFGSQMI